MRNSGEKPATASCIDYEMQLKIAFYAANLGSFSVFWSATKKACSWNLHKYSVQRRLLFMSAEIKRQPAAE